METLSGDRRVSAFRATDAYAVEAYRAAASLRSRECPDLAAEIRRTAVAAGGAVVAASACAAGDASEQHHLRRARATLYESRYYLNLARRFGWLDARRYRTLTLRQDAAVRELDSLLSRALPTPGPESGS